MNLIFLSDLKLFHLTVDKKFQKFSVYYLIEFFIFSETIFVY